MASIDTELPSSLTPDTREKLLAIFELAPIGIGIVDFEGRTVMSNEVLRRMLGYTRDEFARMSFDQFTHPEDIAANLDHFDRLIAGEIDSFQMEKRFLRKDGAIVWGHLTSSLLRDAEGRPEFAIGMLQDITEQKLLTERLGTVQERYRSLVERVPGVVYVAEVGAAGRWHYVSPQSESMLGFTAEEWLADPHLWLRQLHPDDRENVSEDGAIQKRMEQGEAISHCYRMISKDGRTVWIRDDAVLVRSEEHGPLWHGLLVDVTREKDLEMRLEHQAFHDPLTVLPNRRLFRDRVEHCLERLARCSDETAAVLFVDLDNFKAVNDGLGHAHGDELLVLAGERIKRCLRSGDTAARLGGDEFALLIENVTDVHDVTTLAERILEVLSGEPYSVGNRSVMIGASIGIALRSPKDSVEVLLRNADLAMYRAKGLGKGRYAVYESNMHESTVERLRMEEALRETIEHHQRGTAGGGQGLSVVFQPIVDLETSETEGFEALCRWEHPAFGQVGPDRFIALAEDAGLIGELGAWVLNEACATLAAWRKAGGSKTSLSVNVSPRQLEDGGFPEIVCRALKDSELDPEDLIIEVTEGVLLVDASRDALRSLRDIGVKIAIDDFGTGYSSLGYLREFPSDFLKIDRSFVQHIQNGVEDRSFVQAIVKLAASLAIDVIVEGIETTEQLEALRAIGCRIGQGYLLARPAGLPTRSTVSVQA